MERNKQLVMFDDIEKLPARRYSKKDALSNIRSLYAMWKRGELGGEFMPEDNNPHLLKDSDDNYIYFTLPMALNYQRNSYKLWKSALATYNDKETIYLFDPASVLKNSEERIRKDLCRHKLALQPNKHTSIWITICTTLENQFGGSLKSFFRDCDYRVSNILNEIQNKNKKGYPYLSGNKIAHYWLYVLTRYTDLNLIDCENISVAPDTHVIQATQMLGLIDSDLVGPSAQEAAVDAWKEVLRDTELQPIDIHTPMWLWSRGGFARIRNYDDSL